MSIVRIFLGVIIGGGAVAGLLAAAVRFPMVALFLMFGGAGVGLFLLAWHGMKTGVSTQGARAMSVVRIHSHSGFTFRSTRSLAQWSLGMVSIV
jgi:hypothetical protein